MTEHANNKASRYGRETRSRQELKRLKPDKRHVDGPKKPRGRES